MPGSCTGLFFKYSVCQAAWDRIGGFLITPFESKGLPIWLYLWTCSGTRIYMVQLYHFKNYSYGRKQKHTELEPG